MSNRKYSKAFKLDAVSMALNTIRLWTNKALN